MGDDGIAGFEEAVGNVNSVLANLAPGGRQVIVAIHQHLMDFQPTQLVMGETEIVGALAYVPEDFDAVIAAMSEGLYDTTGWIAEVGLEQEAEAIGNLRADRGMKVLVTAHARDRLL